MSLQPCVYSSVLKKKRAESSQAVSRSGKPTENIPASYSLWNKIIFIRNKKRAVI